MINLGRIVSFSVIGVIIALQLVDNNRPNKYLESPGAIKQSYTQATPPIGISAGTEAPNPNQFVEAVRGFETFLSNEERNPTNIPQADLEQIRHLVGLFDNMADFIGKAKADTSITIGDKKYLENVSQRLSKLQSKAFPALRAAYRKRAGETVWEQDIKVSVSGTGNSTITFIGYMFSLNSSIKVFHDQMRSELMKLRFKKVVFRPYDGGDGWSQTQDVPKDSKVSALRFGQFQQ